eukprot:1874943-Rhodomonas_salina.1
MQDRTVPVQSVPGPCVYSFDLGVSRYQYLFPYASTLSALQGTVRCDAISGTDLASSAMLLRAFYAMSGTDLAYAATDMCEAAHAALKPGTPRPLKLHL